MVGHPSRDGNPYRSLPWVLNKGVMTTPKAIKLNLPKF